MKKRALAVVLLAALLLALGAEGALAGSKCLNCGGSGRVRCSNCNGNGKVARYGGVVSGCSYCGGSGRVKCRNCGGDGVIGSGDPGPSGSDSGTHTADLSKTSLTLIAGRSETLKVLWASASVSWSSSNSAVATVSSGGKVKARKAGECTITAKTGGQTLTCRVTVKKKVFAKNIRLNRSKATLMPGGTLDLSYSVSPKSSKITEKWSVSFSSSDKSVVTVDQEGHVTAKKAGKATVTAKLKIKKGKYKKVKCKITVQDGKSQLRKWFNAHCQEKDNLKGCKVGNSDTIMYDTAKDLWIFVVSDEDSMSASECILVFNSTFTGEAYAYYSRKPKPPFTVEVEAEAYIPVDDLSRGVQANWTYTKGNSSFSLANKNLVSLLSGMHVILRDKIGLNGKGGWRDLGLKNYE